MEFFDKLGATLSTAGRDVSQKAKDLSGTAKLNLDIKAKEDEIQKQYTELGKLYYAAHKNDAAAEGINYINSIRTAEQEIARMREEILKIKGAIKCPNCGAQLPEGTGFCGQCGTRIPVAAAPTPASAPAQAAPAQEAAANTSFQSVPAQEAASFGSYQAAPAQAAPAQEAASFGSYQSAPAPVSPEATEE